MAEGVTRRDWKRDEKQDGERRREGKEMLSDRWRRIEEKDGGRQVKRRCEREEMEVKGGDR